jgi:hypothetical protein
MKPTSLHGSSSRVLTILVLSLAGLALVTSQSPVPAQRQPGLTVQPLPSPAGADSSEPQFTVQGDRVILSWLEGGEEHVSLKFAERTASGWSAPQTVHSGHEVYINAYDVPSVRALADGTLAAHWTEKNGPNPEASTIRLSWSKDQGKTWSPPVSPHHDGTQTQHGFVTLFQAPGAPGAPGAGLGLVWLDGRATDPEKAGGDMALRASIHAPDGKQLRESVVDPRACECCSTSAALTSEGVIVAYRDRSASEVRDIYVSRLTGNAWSAPTLVHADGWQINACPINGPAVSARGRDVAVAWFTAKGNEGQAFVAFSRDAGRTFGPAIRVDDTRSFGRLGVHLLADGSAAVSWIEFVDSAAQLRARTVTLNGVRSPAVTVAQDPDTRSPRFAGNARELLFAWTEADENDNLRVRTARAPLPTR